MFTAFRWPAITAMAACALLIGCPGKDGKDGATGPTGTAGTNSLVQLTPEPAGANCATGGTRVESGLDTDADGLLDAAEVTATQFVCNGAVGHDSLLALTAEAAGANCVAGGTRVQSGLDADDDGTLDATEVAATQYVCGGAEGHAALVSSTPEAAGANCAAGGLLVQSGFDADASGTLDAGEVVLGQYLCNGVAGLSALVATTAEAAGANCAHAGTKVDSGLDLNGNGALDASEATATQYVCNGAPGASGLSALIALTPEAAGANCANGGTRIEAGLDLDGDATLDLAEVTSTEFACDGADGAGGLTSLVVGTAEPVGANCADGGLRIQSGLDANANLTLDAAEVASTSYVCGGADGADGQTSLVETYVEPSGANCAWGGLRVLSGLDADGNGLLDGTDPVLTQYVCDGAPGLVSLVATVPEAAGANCADGGVRIDSGLDANRSGALDAGEATTTYVCDGAGGAAGVSALVVTSTEPAGANCPFGGTRIDSGLDANGNGLLDPGELGSAYACNGAPAPEPLVVTSPESPGLNCTYGGTRIEFASDANGNGLIDAGELEATAWACNGATGAGLVTLLAFTEEPAGANCQYGGTRVDSGLDANGNGLLDPVEATSTGYVCDADSSHPSVVAASPTPGSPFVDPNASFCVTFSEPIDPATLTPSSLYLTMYGGPVTADLGYDPATLTACVDPVFPLDLFSSVALTATSTIADAAGNVLLPRFNASYTIQPPPPPNLTVRIDSVTASGDGVDVGYTVTNQGGDASAFTLGFYVDWPYPPSTFSPPDASVDLAGLASLTSSSGTLHLTSSASPFVAAFVDVWDTVGESNEWDNLGLLAPRLAGPISASADPVEEQTELTVTFPVNGSVRRADVYLGLEGLGSWLVAGGSVNTAGEGFATFTFLVPIGPASLGSVAIWVNLFDPWSSWADYQPLGWVSVTNLALLDPAVGGWIDSGIPITHVTVTPSTRPNLRVTVDSVVDLGTGFVDVGYTVTNLGAGDAGASTLGLWADPGGIPGIGWMPAASGDVPALVGGGSHSAVVQLAGSATSAIVAYADIFDVVAEIDESDNLFVPQPILTGPVQVSTTTFEMGTLVTVTVPVGPGVRSAEITLGQDYYWGGNYLGAMDGNYGGEGYISQSFLVPEWWSPMDATVWVRLWDQWYFRNQLYAAVAPISGPNLARYDAPTDTWLDSGIPLTYVTVTPSTRPDLALTVDSVIDLGGGTVQVAYTLRNQGFGDAGPFTVGVYVDPTTPPQAGWSPAAFVDIPGLAVGSSVSGTIEVAAAIGSSFYVLADSAGALSEPNEGNNLATLAPTMTGSPVAAPSPVEEAAQLTITVPVNQSTRRVEICLGGDQAYEGYWCIGTLVGNTAGEGFITGALTVPTAWGYAIDRAVFVRTYDALQLQGREYTYRSYVSANYSFYDGVGYVDSGFPVTWVTIVPSLRPNLRMAIDSITDLGTGDVRVAWRVFNDGAGDAGPFAVGFFVDPRELPVVGATPDASADVPGLAAGATYSGALDIAASALSSILGFADVTGAIQELDENDNFGQLMPAMTGSPTIAPSSVEPTGSLTVSVPVNSEGRNVRVMIGGDYSTGPTWDLGWGWGNYDRQGFIEWTFTVPPYVTPGDWTVWVGVAREGGWDQRTYVAEGTVSTTEYALVDPLGGFWITGIPLTPITVIAGTSPNLTMALNGILPAPGGGLDVTFTVNNNGFSAAGPFSVGFFVDPATPPTVGSTPFATSDFTGLAQGVTETRTINLATDLAWEIYGFVDLTGAVAETNESDNVVLPDPMLTGPVVISPTTVDEGTLLTLSVPVNDTARTVEVYIGDDLSGINWRLGEFYGNYEGQGTIDGALTVPFGPSAYAGLSVWVLLYDEQRNAMNAYVAHAAVAGTDYARGNPWTSVWTDSGIPLTYVTVIPPTRPNLTLTLDSVTDVGGGFFDVTFTVTNVGASDAGAFDVGVYVDPATVPAVGMAADATASFTSLAVGSTVTSTVNLPASGIPAVFALADDGGAIDEQSETDNLAWKLPGATMTGSPVPTATTVVEGETFDVTVPVSGNVRSVEIYVGGLSMMGPGPAFMIGTGTGNTAGEGTITATCTAPPGSAGDWYVWVATYDVYGLEWRGYGSEGALSMVYYTEYVPSAEELRPTTIPLTPLTITP